MRRKTYCVTMLLAATAVASALGSSGCSCSGPSTITEGTYDRAYIVLGETTFYKFDQESISSIV